MTPGWHRDVALALAVGVFEIVATHFAAQNQPDRRTLDAAGMALLASGAAVLVFRRRYPAGVLVFATLTTSLYWLVNYPGGPVFVAMIVAFFTAVMSGHRLVAWVVLIAAFIDFPWLPYLIMHEPAPSLVAVFGLAAWLLVLATVAEVARMRRERRIEAARTLGEQARRQASEERLRIARELHDVLGHHISLINVRASVALHLIDEQPEQARTALAAIKESSKDALRELRSVLGVLRETGEAPLLSPSPSLANLDELVSQAAAAGLQVRIETTGEPRRLPTTVESAAFRIVQEALTNVIKHAGQASVIVRVTHGGRELTLQVEDDGRGAASDDEARGGEGILGMRERAAALGGVVEAGPLPGGGFRVLTRLPLDGDPSTTARTGA